MVRPYKPPTGSELRRIDAWLSARGQEILTAASLAADAKKSYEAWANEAHERFGLSRFDAMTAWQAAHHLRRWKRRIDAGGKPLDDPLMIEQVRVIAARYEAHQRLLVLAWLVGMRIAAAIAARR